MYVCMDILISVCILQHITVCVYLYRALAYILLLLVLFGQRALYVVYTVRLTNWPTGETKFRFIFMQRRGQWKLWGRQFSLRLFHFIICEALKQQEQPTLNKVELNNTIVYLPLSLSLSVSLSVGSPRDWLHNVIIRKWTSVDIAIEPDPNRTAENRRPPRRRLVSLVVNALDNAAIVVNCFPVSIFVYVCLCLLPFALSPSACQSSSLNLCHSASV